MGLTKLKAITGLYEILGDVDGEWRAMDGLRGIETMRVLSLSLPFSLVSEALLKLFCRYQATKPK
jgi:hypothetical protein